MGIADYFKDSINNARAATTEGVKRRVEYGMRESDAPTKPAPAASAPTSSVQFDTGRNPEREKKRREGPPASMVNKYANGGAVKMTKSSTPHKCK